MPSSAPKLRNRFFVAASFEARQSAMALPDNFRGGNGNVGIIRSPVRAIALPDNGVSGNYIGAPSAQSPGAATRGARSV
jgi:hypothetical protein